jgi:hypothetical protein
MPVLSCLAFSPNGPYRHDNVGLRYSSCFEGKVSVSLASQNEALSSAKLQWYKTFFSSSQTGTWDLYYKHIMIVYYASSIVNKLGGLLTDDTRVIIYDRYMFTVQATDWAILH